MKYCFLLCSLVTSLVTHAQRQKDYYALSQALNAGPYTGKKIKLQASLRTEAFDSSARTGLWMRVDKPDNKIGFFKSTWEESRPADHWTTVTIEAEVSKNATRIVLGGLFKGKGQFYYDDFNLQVLNQGNWETVPLFNPSFEDTVAASKDGWYFMHKQDRLPLAFSNQGPATGALSFGYDGIHNVTEYPYGANPEAGKYAQVNGIHIYYEIYGQGQPLLLLHGNGQSIGEYEEQIDFFKKDYQVIAVDTRGQGRSTTDSTRYTYQLFAKDMYELLNQLQLDSVHILGWSDGGNTGLIMAMQYPRKVKKLATMGANIFINKDAVKPMVFSEIRKQLKALAKDTSAKAPNDIRLMHLLQEEPNMRFEDLEVIHCPVLVMAGENDLIKEQHTKGIAQHIAGAQLLIFPKGTHYMPQENARAFNKAVLDFLRQ